MNRILNVTILSYSFDFEPHILKISRYGKGSTPVSLFLPSPAFYTLLTKQNQTKYLIYPQEVQVWRCRQDIKTFFLEQIFLKWSHHYTNINTFGIASILSFFAIIDNIVFKFRHTVFNGFYMYYFDTIQVRALSF